MITRILVTLFSIVFPLTAAFADPSTATLSMASCDSCNNKNDNCDEIFIGVPGKQGPKGPKGDQGKTGSQGPVGPVGPKGSHGSKGERGPKGEKGPKGERGCPGERGHHGCEGPTGPRGPTGPTGLTGPSGGILGFADFYAIPTDNPSPIPAGSALSFPRTSPGTPFGAIDIVTNNTFQLSPGTYQIEFEVNVETGSSTGGQLVLATSAFPFITFNQILSTLVGTDFNGTQIVGSSILFVPVTTQIQIQNPIGQAPLTISPDAGNTGSGQPTRAHLVILQLR